MTAPQLAQHIAASARYRLDRNLTQQELADRAGMSLSSLRRFERTGEIAFLSLVRIAMELDHRCSLKTVSLDEGRSADAIARFTTAPFFGLSTLGTLPRN